MFYKEFEKKRSQFIAGNKAYAAKYKPHLPKKGYLMAEGEIKKYYTFNETGNVMVSSTVADEKDIQPAVLQVFQKASVFLLMMTAALNKKGKTLYDYEAWNDIIAGSGKFVAMHEEDRTFDYASKEFTLNTAIISAALGSISPMGGALQIAQKVIDSLGGQLRIASSDTKTSKKIAHMLLVCENLMGMPLVNVSLFYVDSKEAQTVSKSNCHGYVSTAVNFKYHQQDYMFVDPDYINKYAKEFTKDPEQDKLIDEFAGLIKEHK